MTVSVSELAERALRRLGFSIVPLDDSPVFTEMVPVATIATMALTELGVIAADETPTASDQALALDKVNSVQGAIDAQGLVWWDPSEVPRAFVEEYAKLTAMQAATSFGKQADPQVMQLLEARIKRGVMEMSGHDIAVEAVMAVHNNLLARGLARWSTQDIPEWVAGPYEVIAADFMSAKFGGQVDNDDLAAAWRALAQMIALPSSGQRVQATYF